jgi:lipoyl(octanoyl) transferase
LICCQLGRVAYEESWQLQKLLQARLIQAARSGEMASTPQSLLLLEHPPTYTLGKSGKKEHLLLSDRELTSLGASFYDIGRGGDITYHGPGQLVGYPILDLHLFHTDLTRFVRTLEEMAIRTCTDFGVVAHRSDAGTGVWIGKEARERKICAIGIRCSRWVSMHGFAFNINTDLSFFNHIVPCGIADRGVTTLSHEIGETLDEARVRSRLMDHFEDLFGVEMVRLGGQAATEYAESFASSVT